ncbi:hypothetical protein H4R34_004405 [Dimargaris verticillata]|uniref:U three protein 23 n=1 Tax=Dimargaris verticillata TaxID=2761393 RepID=A0A9W8E796_9FUNG|nr:hypothetical protein H4R34_004405 [Dimargaris verticillata]
MRVKRTKANKRHMQIYKKHFAFREPYQVILDGEFVYQGLAYKVDLRETLPKLMHGRALPLVTPCVLHELNKRGEEYEGAAIAASRLGRHSCKHEPKLSGIDCIQAMVGETNAHHYGVCTADIAVRAAMRRIPGVPLFHYHDKELTMEAPSEATKKRCQGGDAGETTALSKELSLLGEQFPEVRRRLEAKAKQEADVPIMPTTTRSNREERVRKKLEKLAKRRAKLKARAKKAQPTPPTPAEEPEAAAPVQELPDPPAASASETATGESKKRKRRPKKTHRTKKVAKPNESPIASPS